MMQATRRFQFCAGHRVHKHESKCNNMHGHNYVLVVYAEAPDLDPLGRVMDFSEIKGRILPWLDAHWDHGFLVKFDDSEVRHALGHVPSQKVYVMEENPTAENMCAHLLRQVFPMLFAGSSVRITKVELWETENCSVVMEA